MKFIHTSDLHIGKTVNGFSMLEEQEHVLNQIAGKAGERGADAVFICGDLYDRPVPPASAVSVLDGFLTGLSEQGIAVLAIAGNHDCRERIDFGRRVLARRGLYIEGSLSDPARYVDFQDAWGRVRVHLVPFAKPSQVRDLCGQEVLSYEESMRAVLSRAAVLKGERNLLLAHQFVTDGGVEPETCESEERVCVGGADQVDVSNFAGFSYTALGHLHGCQQVGRGNVYYSGSPLKYSFSEVLHEKCALFGELDGEGKVNLERLPLTPIRDMRKIRGRLSALISPEVASLGDAQDYILAVLTDAEELADPMGTLRSVYPNVMQLQWEKRERDGEKELPRPEFLSEKNPVELFRGFFETVTGQELDEAREAVVKRAVNQAKEELR